MYVPKHPIDCIEIARQDTIDHNDDVPAHHEVAVLPEYNPGGEVELIELFRGEVAAVDTFIVLFYYLADVMVVVALAAE